ncbi:MAG: trypsin-like peptidase domain-containing protein [Deltaproteobacteria bacterium]|nr:trypsin-like peptidase domain-containing protein [Deltaproteobacteria bacterium]
MAESIDDPYVSDGNSGGRDGFAPADDDGGGPAPPDSEPPPSGRFGQKALLVTLAVLIFANAGVFLVLSQNLYERFRKPPDANALVPPIEVKVPARPSPSSAPLPEELTAAEERTIAIFSRASPAVVFITTMAVRKDPFRRNVMTIPAGSGSGFVWDDKGHIVTNYHVIREADAARVTLADQSGYDAKLVGHAIDKDLAVLKIAAPADKLQPLARGTSQNLAVGQRTLAIGNPFGLDHTLSTGVVSGLGREIKSLAERPIFGVIQTDAAINPGNSGGPLLDSSGRLIGVNTAIYSPTGASAGIGFAVPVDTVERVVPQLIQYGKVVRPGLGIQFDPAIQSRIGVKGVLVLGVMADSPAEKAGIRPTTRNSLTGSIVLGDVIVAIDGGKIEHQNDLFKALDDKAVGDTVKVTVKRGDKTRDLAVTLASLGAR